MHPSLLSVLAGLLPLLLIGGLLYVPPAAGLSGRNSLVPASPVR
jgi:hypothetical protein